MPTDCVLIQTSDPSGQGFIQTSSLDGERNLKPKIAIKQVQENLSSIFESSEGKLEVICPAPEKNLY